MTSPAGFSAVSRRGHYGRAHNVSEVLPERGHRTGGREVVASSRSVSVKDVAAAAGVSLGTVSNVLNRPDRVSVSTRQRVQPNVPQSTT